MNSCVTVQFGLLLDESADGPESWTTILQKSSTACISPKHPTTPSTLLPCTSPSADSSSSPCYARSSLRKAACSLSGCSRACLRARVRRCSCDRRKIRYSSSTACASCSSGAGTARNGRVLGLLEMNYAERDGVGFVQDLEEYI